MGGCMRKPVLVYQSILEECYDLMYSCNGQIVPKKKEQKISSTTNNSTGIARQGVGEQQFHNTECTQAMKESAAESLNEFNKMDTAKLKSQVKLQAKTLSDHIQDTHIRLIDSVYYLKEKLMKEACSYGVQWITLQILEELVMNLKNYTQQHISLKHAQGEDSNIVSKMDNLTENNDINSKRNKQDEPQSIEPSKQEQITFFSDNFIRFEMDFLEISLFILNEKANPFYQASRNHFLSILLKFSSLHKDPYTSEKIYQLSDQLELDIEYLARELLETPSLAMDTLRLQTFQQLMGAYSETLSKIKTSQSVFRSKKQIAFFQFLLQTIIDFNKRLKLTSLDNTQKIQENQKGESMSGVPSQNGNNSSPILQGNSFQGEPNGSFIAIECIKIIRVFARRSFILKNYNALLSNLFSFFDEVKWDPNLMIELIINDTIAVSCEESVQLNYKVYLLEQLIEYLQLTKPQGQALPSMLLHANTLQTQVADISKLKPLPLQHHQSSESTQLIEKDLKLHNFANPIVKVRALKLFNILVEQRDREMPLLLHSTSKIIKCYLENLKEFSENSEVKKSLQQSFSHYALQFAPDSSSLLSLLTTLSGELADYFSQSSQSKAYQMLVITPRMSNPPNTFKLQKEQQPQQQQQQQQQQHQQHPHSQDSMKYIFEGLILLLNTLDSAEGSFIATPLVTDEIIINLLFLGNIKSMQLLAFEAIHKILLFKLNPLASASDSSQPSQSYLSSPQNGITNSLNSHSFLHISQNSLLHILYQCVKCIDYLNIQQPQQNDMLQNISNSIIISHFIVQILEQVVTRNNLLLNRAIISFIVKLFNDLIAHQQLPPVIPGDAFQNSPLKHGENNNNHHLANKNTNNNSNNPNKVNSAAPPARPSIKNNEIQSSLIVSQQIHFQKVPVCQNIFQVIIMQLLPSMLPLVHQNEQLQKAIEIESRQHFQLMTTFQNIYSLHTKMIQIRKNNLSNAEQQQKEISSPFNKIKGQDELHFQTEKQYYEKILQLSEEIQETPFLKNKLFEDSSIIDSIIKVAKSQGISSDQSFEEMTAQFARNFTSAVGEIDFLNFNSDDDPSLFMSHNTVNKSKRGSMVNPFKTNESLGQFEKDDEEFGNILGMIQRRDLQIPNIFRDENGISFYQQESASNRNQGNKQAQVENGGRGGGEQPKEDQQQKIELNQIKLQMS